MEYEILIIQLFDMGYGYTSRIKIIVTMFLLDFLENFKENM